MWYQRDPDSYGAAAGEVFLTFDDGPDLVWTVQVLEALAEAEAVATFFVVAPRVRAHPGVVERILCGGHRVEFHCEEHVRHTERGREEVRRDVEEGLGALEAAGVRARLWRPPWGVRAEWTREVAAEYGLRLVGWTHDTHDWRGDRAEEMLAAVGHDFGVGSNVLMHDGLGPGARRAGCEETVALVGPLVRRVRESGLEPGTGEVLAKVSTKGREL